LEKSHRHSMSAEVIKHSQSQTELEQLQEKLEQTKTSLVVRFAFCITVIFTDLYLESPLQENEELRAPRHGYRTRRGYDARDGDELV